MSASVQFIREATLDDIPFIRELAREKYPERPVDACEAWMRECIQRPDRLVLVGQNSVGVSQVDRFYGIEIRGRMGMLCSRTKAGSFEVLHMVRIMVSWAKKKGAKPPFTLDADKQSGVDFGPFAQRLGGERVEYVKYHLPFED